MCRSVGFLCLAALSNTILFAQQPVQPMRQVAKMDEAKRKEWQSLWEKRYWVALAPYDATIQQKVEADHKPDSWGGLKATPWYLALQSRAK